MLQPCPQCGAANSETAEVCYVCDAPFPAPDETLDASEHELVPVAVPSSEPEWRLEVAHRLESYRKRRRSRTGEPDPQVELPFLMSPAEAGDAPPQQPRRPAESRPRASVGIEIAVLQSSLDFSAEEHAHPSAPLVPVADLEDRSRAALYDALFLAGSYIGFLVLFGSLGGQLTLGKLDAAVYGVTLFLLYAQYFTLFTFFNGSTPGMHLLGLRVVSFDGSAPSPAQLLWRSFGYLLSAGTLLLGFLWALWDEDRLTWQDRISQTYVTHAPAPE